MAKKLDFPIVIPIVIKKNTSMGRKRPRAKTKTVLKPVKQWDQHGNMQNWISKTFLNKNHPTAWGGVFFPLGRECLVPKLRLDMGSWARTWWWGEGRRGGGHWAWGQLICLLAHFNYFHCCNSLAPLTLQEPQYPSQAHHLMGDGWVSGKGIGGCCRLERWRAALLALFGVLWPHKLMWHLTHISCEGSSFNCNVLFQQ